MSYGKLDEPCYPSGEFIRALGIENVIQIELLSHHNREINLLDRKSIGDQLLKRSIIITGGCQDNDEGIRARYLRITTLLAEAAMRKPSTDMQLGF